MNPSPVVVVLVLGIVCLGFGAGAVYMDAPERGVSMYGPVDENAISGELDVVMYEELSHEEQQVFRSNQLGIRDSDQTHNVVVSDELYTDSDVISLDGDFYVVSEYEPSPVNSQPLLYGGLIGSVSLFLVLSGVVFGNSILQKSAGLFVQVFGVESIPLFKKLSIRLLGVCLLVGLSGFMFLVSPPEFVVLEETDSYADEHVVSYADLTDAEQDEFIELITSDSPSRASNLVLSDSPVEVIKSDGEVYKFTEVETPLEWRVISVFVGLFFGFCIWIPIQIVGSLVADSVSKLPAESI